MQSSDIETGGGVSEEQKLQEGNVGGRTTSAKRANDKTSAQEPQKQITDIDVANNVAKIFEDGDKEILEQILGKHKEGNVISPDFVSQKEKKIIKEYTDALANKKVASALENKTKEEAQAYENFLKERNITSDDVEKEMQNALRSGSISKEDYELAKSEKGIFARKFIVENQKYASKYQKPLPDAINTSSSKEDILKELQELDSKRVKGQSYSTSKYNELWAQYTQLSKK